MEAIRITAHPSEGGGFVLDAYDAKDLFDYGTKAFEEKRCEDAVMAYDKLVAEFIDSRFVGPALFNAGLCLQATADFAAAAERYRKLRELRPSSDDYLYTSLRLAEVLVQLEAFDDTLALSEELLARTDLDPYQRLEAMARKSQALLGQGKLDEAENHAKSAISYFRTRPADEAVADEFYVAANAFILGEVNRLRAEAIPFPADPEGQKRALTSRAEWVVKAQRAYSDTISYIHLDNYHWMTASGYRIGQTFDGLWQAVMTAPPPAQLDEEGVKIYRQELAKLIKPLIRHAIRYWEMTLLLVERNGIQNTWTEKTRADLERVRALMLEQPPGPGGLPPEGEQTTAQGASPAAAPASIPTAAPSAAPAPTAPSVDQKDVAAPAAGAKVAPKPNS